MDLFLKRQLFADDLTVLLGQPKERANGEDTHEKLRSLLTAHGGVVIDQHDGGDVNARVNVVLLTGQEEDQNRNAEMVASRFPSASILRSQWVIDSVKENRRLDTASYCVRGPHNTAKSPKMEISAFKKQKVAGMVNVLNLDETYQINPEASLLKPKLRPWKTVKESLLFLDSRAQEEKGESEINRSYKIAGFDLDNTLIVTKSGKKFSQGRDDWKWFHPTLVKDKLGKLIRDEFTLVIFSNQNGVAKGHVTAAQLQYKLEAIVKQLDLPMLIFLSTKNDIMRKPRLGAWNELVQLLRAKGKAVINTEASFYCGDAAGRPKIAGRSKDFAATDYKFSLNAGIRFFTPENLFLGSKQRIHSCPDLWELGFDPKSITINKDDEPLLSPESAQAAKEEQELIVLVGPPASGKSFFSKRYLNTYVHVSQDELRTAALCKKKSLEAIAQKKSVVIDNTNRDVRARKEWVLLAKEKSLPIRCFVMDVDKMLSMHLNTFRLLTQQKNIPDVAIHGFYKNFVPPTVEEGFTEVVKVLFRVDKYVSKADQELLRSYI